MLDKVAARRFPTDVLPGFGALGLIRYARLENGGSWCTPTNSVAFATTGGDGIHFSFLVQDGRVTEKSPVVITVPEPSDQPNTIGGESLFDFLCLGYHRGYFALGALACDKGFAAYASAHWQPHDEWDYAYEIDEHQKRLLAFLIAELGLKPWKDLKRRFQRLQKRYLPLLEMPDTSQGSG